MADDLLPNNKTPFEVAQSETSARMLDLPTETIRLMRRASTIPAQFLPWMAWERSVDVWDPQWSEETKRNVIAASFEIHQHKGTRYALDLAMSSIGLAIETQEWFEYAGGAYRFRLIVNMDTIGLYNAALHANVVNVAFAAKNTRSYLENITVRRPGTPGPVYVGCAPRSRLRVRITYDPLTSITAQGMFFVGAGAFSRMRIRVQ